MELQNMDSEPTTTTTFRTFHMCQSVEGPLLNWTTRDWKQATKWMTRDDGSKMTAMELKAAFVELLGEGKKVIPLGKPCEGFSYETGCPGHPAEDEG